jgi:hypothetical protein
MRTGRHAGHIATAARESRDSALLSLRCLSQKELRRRNYDSGDDSQRARKQQKVDCEPGHDMLPTPIQAAPSHRGLRPLSQGGGRAREPRRVEIGSSPMLEPPAELEQRAGGPPSWHDWVTARKTREAGLHGPPSPLAISDVSTYQPFRL